MSLARALVAAVLTCGAVQTAHAAEGLATPAGWPAPHYQFENNPVTPAGIELGRQLFYDPQLSRDGSISCASCHQQAAAFAHTRHRVSHGIEGKLGTRNAPALFNLAWQPDFMWDGAVSHIELQPLAPLANPLEMGASLPQVLDTLRADASYPARFAQAFGSPDIDSQRLLRALTQFMGTMVSADSAYDRAAHGGAPLPATAQRGLVVFRQQCASCHTEPLFSDYRYRNNGLDAKPADAGRFGISGDQADTARFRVPSLRNIALTAPYMHDGRFETLDAVLEHYAHGVQPSATLDPLLAKGLRFSDEDHGALLAFLHSLTDERFIHDARYAEPRATPATIAEAPAGWTHRVRDAFASVLAGNAEAHEAAPSSAASRDSGVSRVAISAPPIELVVVRITDGLLLYVDDYLSNAPLTGLDITLLAGTRASRASAQGNGVYRVPLEIADTAMRNIRLVIQGPQIDVRLDATLPDDPAAETHAAGSGRVLVVIIASLLSALASATLVLRRRRLRSSRP